MTKYILILLVLLSQTLRAEDFGEKTLIEPSPAAIQAAAAELERILSPRMMVLDRELVTFHYERAQEYQPKTLRDLQGHILNWGERFFDASIEDDSDMEGPGVYVALDPASSRTFGGSENPQLYVIPVIRGARLLNGSIDYKTQERVALKKIRQDLGCDSPQGEQMNDFSDVVPAFRNGKNVGCRKAIATALQRLGTQGILYGYSGSSTLDGCRQKSLAINIVDSRIIRGDKIALYYNDLVDADPAQPGFVARLYREAARDFQLRLMQSSEDDQIPRSLVYAKAELPAYHKWKSEKIYGCGRLWAGEQIDKASDLLLQTLKRTFEDHELQELLIKSHRAYDKIYAVHSAEIGAFSVASINQIDQLAYKMVFGTDSSKQEQWKKAKEKMNSGSGRAINIEIEKILEEKYQPQSEETSDEEFKRMTKDLKVRGDSPFPALLLVANQKAGYGPRLGKMWTNSTLMSLGYVPFLFERFPGKGPESELMAKNRQGYKDILRECLKVYEDPSLEWQKLNDMPCGIPNK